MEIYFNEVQETKKSEIRTRKSGHEIAKELIDIGNAAAAELPRIPGKVAKSFHFHEIHEGEETNKPSVFNNSDDDDNPQESGGVEPEEAENDVLSKFCNCTE